MADYVTGDVHADQVLWDAYIHPMLKAGDRIFVLGDFGVGFWDGRYWSEEAFYDFLAQQPYTVLFCDGNHEDFNKLNAYPVSIWNGGRVHKIRSNVIHLMRGEIFNLEGKKLLAFGGGYSFDKAIRTEGYDWWPEEMPNQAEYKNASDHLLAYNNQVDYILTHTCPVETISYMMTKNLGVHGDNAGERPLTLFLEYLRSTVSYDKWYFGHFHVDMELWRNQYALLRAVRDLHTGEDL